MKLTLPATLSVVMLAAACADDPSPADGGTSTPEASVATDAVVLADSGRPDVAADAGLAPDTGATDSGPVDAGCLVFQVFDPATGMCVPVA